MLLNKAYEKCKWKEVHLKAAPYSITSSIHFWLITGF